MQNNKNIDNFKFESLNSLQLKKEKSKNYTINKKDLIKIDQCLVCKSKNIINISEVFKNKLLFNATSCCQNCNFTFRSISPKLSWFKKCWKKIEKNKLEVFQESLEKSRYIRYKKYYKLVKPYLKGNKLLDIGAAYGTGSLVFKERGFKVYAIEPDNNKYNYLTKKNKVNVIKKYIEDISDVKIKFDIIILANCLEHLDNPIKALKDIRKIINIDGLVYLDLPNLWRYISWSDSLYLTHKSYFTYENLKYILRKIGFKIIKKIKIKHQKQAPLDLGLLIKKTKKNCNTNYYRDINKTKIIYSMYKKGLPGVKNKYFFPEVIKFKVKNIEHFYQTINLNKYEISYSEGFINLIRSKSVK